MHSSISSRTVTKLLKPSSLFKFNFFELQAGGLFSSRIYSIKGVNEASTTFFVVCLHVVWMFIQTIGFVLEKGIVKCADHVEHKVCWTEHIKTWR